MYEGSRLHWILKGLACRRLRGVDLRAIKSQSRMCESVSQDFVYAGAPSPVCSPGSLGIRRTGCNQLPTEFNQWTTALLEAEPRSWLTM